MWDARVGGKEVVVECFAGIDACEVTRLGDGNEQLLASGGVDDEVIDGFVCDGAFALVLRLGGIDVWCCRKHVEDSFGIRNGEVFTLVSMLVEHHQIDV